MDSRRRDELIAWGIIGVVALVILGLGAAAVITRLLD